MQTRDKHLRYILLLFCWIFLFIGIACGQSGPVSFTDQTSKLQDVNFSGVSMGVVDLNGDGKDDILRYRQGRDLRVEFQNAPGQNFSKYSFGNLDSKVMWSSVVADVDRDGYNDIVCGGAYTQINLLKSNSGNSFSRSKIANSSIFTQGMNMVDMDEDGWVDLFACHDDGDSREYRNNRSGGFFYDQNFINTKTTPSSDNSGNYASIWTDYDNDGDLDLYISKCRSNVSSENDPRRLNMLMVNDGNNNFTENAAGAGLKIGRQTWITDFGDIDNDGDMDAIVVNHHTDCQIFKNNGSGFFTEVTSSTGILPSLEGGAAFGIQTILRDFNNDGFLDVLFAGSKHYLFYNDGDFTFTQAANPFTSNQIESFAVGDLNHDGFLDVYAGYAKIFTTPSDKADRMFFNNGNNNNFLAIQLKGTTSNVNAIGARVEIHGSWGKQIRDVKAGESYGISNSFTQHFGLGTANRVDKIVVNWPSGQSTTINNPAINQFLKIVEEQEVIVPGDCGDYPSTDLNGNGIADACEGCDIIDFDGKAPFNYFNQDFGTLLVDDAGATAQLNGNAWKAFDFDYEVTENTVLTFDFKSTAEGEIHEIFLDNQLTTLSPLTPRFVLYGTQQFASANRDYSYSGSGQFEYIEIPIGEFYTGDVNYLVLTSDNDANPSSSNSFFRNIRIFEDSNGDLACDGSNSAPVAVIEADQLNGVGSLNVNFDASSSSDPDGDNLTYSWDFGDGSSASSASPTHNFNSPGTYTVVLIVSDGNVSDEETITVTVLQPNSRPNAVINASTLSGDAPLSVTFDASSSSDPDGDNLLYNWDFGDGSTGREVSESHTFDTPGTYTVTLIASDEDLSDETTVQIQVNSVNNNNPPSAGFTTSSTTGNAPHNVTFNASSSFDIDGDNLTYSWNFGDGSNGTGVATSHNFVNPGNYNVVLTVSDGFLTDQASVTIIAQGTDPNSPPNAFFTASSTSGPSPLSITFDASGSDDPDDDALNYSWSFGDGFGDSGISPTHIFEDIGTFTVRLTVTDGEFSDQYTTQISVIDGPLSCDDSDQDGICDLADDQYDLWIEAECGTVGNNWDVLSDNQASNDSYVEIRPGVFFGSGPTDDADLLRYTFEVNQTATYRIWCRTQTATKNDDSFWVKMDNQPWNKWNGVPNVPNWKWSRVFNENGIYLIYQLNAGTHTLRIGPREDGAKLDKILITDSTIEPENLGNDGVNCPDVSCPMIGDSCNDNDECTTNDVYDENCNCSGTYQDSDNDGICDALDNEVDALWLEAECADRGANWIEVSDADASNSRYAKLPNGLGFADFLNTKNQLTFKFTLPQGGVWHMFARSKKPSVNDDSFFIQVNGGSWVPYSVGLGADFEWTPYTDFGNNYAPVNLNLAAGENVIIFSLREDGSELDKIHLNKTNVQPSVLGEEGSNCDPGLINEPLRRRYRTANTFDALALNDRVALLSWNVDQDEIPRHYELEHLTSHGSFETVAQVAAEYQSGMVSYEHKLRECKKGLNVFRLKVVLVSGEFYYVDEDQLFFRNQIKDVVVYPNPASNWMRVELTEIFEGELTWEIYNINGQLMKQHEYRQLRDHSIEVDVSDLNSGLYLIKVNKGDQRGIVKKFSVLK